MHLVMIVLSIPHGPDETDGRCLQVQFNMEQHYKSADTRPSPLFQSGIARIARELKNIVQQMEGESLEDAILRYARERNSFRRTGYRAKKVRYLQVLHSARELVQCCGLSTNEVTSAAVETDAINKRLLHT